MATLTLSQVIGGGGGGGTSPPTALLPGVRSNVVSETIASMAGKAGATISAGVASTTLTEVLGITGSGVLMFLCSGAIGVTQTAPKMRVIIDGTTVLDDVYADRTVTRLLDFVIGFYTESTGSAAQTSDHVIFSTSLSILIAGDAVDESKAAYRYYLT